MRLGSLWSALTLIAVVALCSGCGSSDSSKVSAGTYVSALCSAISPLETDVVTRSAALKKQTAKSASEAKKNLRGFLDVVEQDSAHALSRIQSAGTPDISNGKVVAGTIVKTFTQLRDAMRAAVTKSATLPTDSPQTFQTAAQALLASVGNSLNKIDSSGLNNPDVEKAEAGQAACKSLNSAAS
jgi:type IV pilus biogenesis protein CpaD/CtpE